MTDHTPAPEPVCGARHLDAVNAALVCELPPGHGRIHRAHTTATDYTTWPDQMSVPTAEAAYRWAESVASTGAGADALIEIDITVPNAAEPIPVVIPLAQARELHDMLGGVLAEHNAPTPHPEGCPGCETCDLTTQLSAEREAHDAHRTLIAKALALTTGSGWDAIQDCAAKTRKAAKERAAALQDARDELAAAGYPTDSNGWLILAPAIRKLAADVKLLRGNSEVDRREASNRRQALAEALGLGTGAGWDAITDRARQVTADLDAARAGDAPWIRAHREDLEDAKKHAKEAAEEAHEEHRRQLADALGGLGPDTPWDSLIRRAAQVLAGRHRAFDMAQEIEADRDRLAAELAAARAGDAPWIRAYREDLTGVRQRAEQAEATIARVRDAVVQWRGWNPTENAWAIRDIEHALSGDPDPRPQDPAALDGEQPAAAPDSDGIWALVTCRRMPTRTCPPSGPCPGPCARFDSNDPGTWEQAADTPPEPTTNNVTDWATSVEEQCPAHYTGEPPQLSQPAWQSVDYRCERRGHGLNTNHAARLAQGSGTVVFCWTDAIAVYPTEPARDSVKRVGPPIPIATEHYADEQPPAPVQPRCTCAGAGFGNGDCAAHYPPEVEPEPEPQPREVCCGCGSPDVVYHNYRDLPFCRRCAASTAVEYGGHGYHPPTDAAEPETVPVLDALVADILAAFRRALTC